MNMSKIIQYDESTNMISSQAEKIKFCQGEEVKMDDRILDICVHPGERFNIKITVLALDQSGSREIRIQLNYILYQHLLRSMLVFVNHF